MHRVRTLATVALALAILLAGVQPARAQVAADGQVDVQACAIVADDDLRQELNAVTQQIFAGFDARIDVAAIVAQQWVRLDMDATLAGEVDQAVARLRQREDQWNQFLSGWSSAKAEELTRQVAAEAFGSETFRAKLEELSAAVATAIAAEIEPVSTESTSWTLLCLQQHIGSRYTAAIVDAFARELEDQTQSFTYMPDQGMADGVLAVLDTHRTALGGIGVIVVAQVTKRMVQKVGQTIAKRVAGRLVGRIIGKAGATVIPLVGWIVGGGLIVYDVLDSLDGALPQIQASLTAPEVRAAIQAELVAVIEPELRLELPQIGRTIANELYGEWLDFQRTYRQVLSLVEEDARLAAHLAGDADLPRLANIVDMALAAGGREGLDRMLDDGSLAQLLALPDAGLEIFQATGSAETAQAWAELAGNRLGQVAALEVYKHKAPADLDRRQLDALLAVDDPQAIANLMLLDSAALDRLLTLSTASLAQLARQLSPSELTWLSSYVAAMNQQQVNQLITRVLDRPDLMAQLADDGVQSFMVQSGDVDATLAFLEAPADVATVAGHLLKLAAGDVPLRLFAFRYGWPLTAGAVGLPLLLALALIYALAAAVLRPFVAVFRWLGRGRPASSGRRE